MFIKIVFDYLKLKIKLSGNSAFIGAVKFKATAIIAFSAWPIIEMEYCERAKAYSKARFIFLNTTSAHLKCVCKKPLIN